MTFKAKLCCDGCMCNNEKELNSEHPSDVEVEYYSEEQWLIGENNFVYCPTCKPQVIKEYQEGTNQ